MAKSLYPLSSYFKRVRMSDFAAFVCFLAVDYGCKITDFPEDHQVLLFEEYLSDTFVPLSEVSR